MKRYVLSLFHPIWPAVALLVGLVAAMSITSAQALPSEAEQVANIPGMIDGKLYEPDGVTPVAGGWIDIVDAQEQPWMGTDTAPDGSFTIRNLPPNIYYVRAYPPPNSPFAASTIAAVEVLAGRSSPVVLQLTAVSISGYVRDCDAVPEQRISDAWVAAARVDQTVKVWDTTNISGEFKLGGLVPGISYTLQAFPPPESEYVALEPITVIPVANGVILEVCMPPLSILGTIHDPGGNPVPGGWAVIWNDLVWDETTTDISGTFAFNGLPPGEFFLHAGPPWGTPGLISIEPIAVSVSPPPTVTNVGVITLRIAAKTLTGHVYNEGTFDGVPNAEVTAHRLDEPGFASAPTDGNGLFSLSLTGGEWHIGAAPLLPPGGWIYANPPEWIVFAPDNAPESKTVTLEVVPANASVSGTIVCPPNIVPCPPGDVMRVELRNDHLRTESVVGGNPRTYPFGLPIPEGWYELLVHVDDPNWQGPKPIPLYVSKGAAVDVGAVVLRPKDAVITGKVRGETGVGVPFVPVVGWQPDGGGWGYTSTDAKGDYTMPVIEGEWFIEPQPEPKQPYVYRHKPALVRVAAGGRLEGINFDLSRATARIKGTAVDANTSERLWGLDGWAWAERLVTTDTVEFFSDAPMRDSSFELKVKGNAFYRVGVEVSPQARYVSGGTGPIGVPNLAEVPVSVPLQAKDAAVTGRLMLADSAPAAPALGVWAEVFGEDEAGHWVAAGVDQDTARYGMGVVSGTWRLRAWVDPASGYVAIPTATVVSVQSGKLAAPIDFSVWPISSLISGTVTAPDGTPQEAIVFAEGDSPFVGHFATHVWSDARGHFELLVPEGKYMVGATLPGNALKAQGWLNPAPVDVPYVGSGSPILNLELRFRLLDGEIHGTIRFAPSISITATRPAYVWGWSDSGEWAEALATRTGSDSFTYTLQVVSDTVWHIGAVYEDGDSGVFYESLEAIVAVPPAPPIALAFRNLELRGPYALPQPLIVSFDATQMQTIVMPDGVVMHIPPRALVNTGTVTLFIFPTRELRPERGREIIGVGYEIWAVDENGREITQFNKNMLVTFPYPSDAKLQQLGISEQLLIPVYYSTLAGRWILADSYVLDTVKNKIRLQINHFSRFGTFSLEQGDRYIYLPLVLQSSQ